MATIDEKTKVPLFVVVGVVPFLIGFILWLASVDAKATKGAEGAEKIDDIKIDVAVIRKILEQKEKN